MVSWGQIPSDLTEHLQIMRYINVNMGKYKVNPTPTLSFTMLR